MRPAANFARSLVFAIDTRPRLGVERPGESGVDVETTRPAAPSSRSGSWRTRKLRPDSRRIGAPRAALDDHVSGDAVARVDGNAADCAPHSGVATEEMQRFAGHLATNGCNRISRGRRESESNDRARPCNGRRDREPRSLRGRRRCCCAQDQSCSGELRAVGELRNAHEHPADPVDGSIVISVDALQLRNLCWLET